ncbi:Arginine biosynthesis protein ArgJ, partial [mine drainage metagenome]
RQRQLRHGRARCGDLPDCLQGCRAGIWIFRAGDISFFHGHHRGAAPWREAGRRAAAIAAQLGETAAHVQQFAEAILTTDTRAKIASAEIKIGDRQVRLLGVAKGAGMIAPRLVPHATMLVYLFTDASVASHDLQKLLNDAVQPTFNCIS